MEKPILVIRLEEKDTGDLIEDPIVLEGLAIRQLHHWLDNSIRLERSSGAESIMMLAAEGVYQQAEVQGWKDAHDFGEERLSKYATPLWKEGYTQGFAFGMSERADDADRRMAEEGDTT